MDTGTTSIGYIPLFIVSNSTLSKAKDLSTYKAADVVNLFYPPVLITVGTVVNILSILVMRTPSFRHVSTSVYMVASAINDLVSLYVSLLTHWLFVNFPDIFVRGVSLDNMCRIFNFYGFSNCDFTMVLTVCMTADRAYAIKFPFKVASVDMVKRAKFVISVAVLFVFVKNVHFFFCSSMSPPTSTERLCVVTTTNHDFEFYVDEVRSL